MHILALLATLIGGGLFWLYRAQNATHAAHDLIDMAKDVRGAAHRFNFRRKANRHPMESVDEPAVAIMTIAASFFELDARATQDTLDALIDVAEHSLGYPKEDVDEMLVLARWLSNQCPHEDIAISRMSRRLYKIDGTQSAKALMEVIEGTFERTGLEMTERQNEALHRIQRLMKI